MFKKALAFSIILFLFLLTGCNQDKIQNEDPVKIGAILTLTGWGSYLGEGASRGTELAEKDINEINDRKLQILVEDSKTNNQDAVTAVNKLLSIDAVDAIYVEFSGPSSSVSDIVQSSNKIMLFSAFPSIILKQNPISLKTYFDDFEECKRLAEEASKKSFNKFAVLLINLPFAEACEEAIKEVSEQTDSEIIYSERFNIEETNFQTYLTKIKNSKVDVILAIVYEDHAINILQQKVELGVNIPFYCGGKNDCLTSQVLESVPHEALENSITFNFDIDERFKKRYKELYGDTTEVELQAAALAYDGIAYLYYAIKDCGNSDPECAIERIQSTDYKSIVKSSGFSSKRRLELDSRIEVFENGEFVPASPISK